MMLLQCCWLLFCMQASSARGLPPSKPYLKDVNVSYHRLLAENPNTLLVPYEEGSGTSDQREGTCAHSTLQQAVRVLQKIALNCGDRIEFESCCEPKFVRHHWLSSTLYPLKTPSKLVKYAYCDMENQGGGWIVILRRGYKNKFRPVVFERQYRRYVRGFGKLNREFWLGFQTVREYISQNGGVELLVEARLAGGNGTTLFARYNNFSLGPRSTGYALHVAGYNEGSSLPDSLSYSNGFQFKTEEDDNPYDHILFRCTAAYNGPWWYENWYESSQPCTKASLFRFSSGLDWLPREPPAGIKVGWDNDNPMAVGNNRELAGGPLWMIKGQLELLEYVEMKIRPKTWECGADPYSEYELKKAYLHPWYT